MVRILARDELDTMHAVDVHVDIGAVVLKEPFGRSRIAAAALVATGVTTIHLAG